MWFKTRVGLVSVTEPSQIGVGGSDTSAGVVRWWIYARAQGGQEVNFKGVMGVGGGKISNPVSYLAMFTDGPAVHDAIGECMERITASLETNAQVCDLSQSGDLAAWGKNWRPVQWRNRGEPAA